MDEKLKRISPIDIPEIVFNEFKDGEEKIIEKEGISYHIARLRIKRKPKKISREFTIAHAKTCFDKKDEDENEPAYLKISYLIILKGGIEEINKENIFQKKIISIYLGPDFTSNQPSKKNIIFFHIIDNMVLSYTSAIGIAKIILRTTQLFHSKNCKKNL